MRRLCLARAALALLVLLATAHLAGAATLPPGFQETAVIQGLANPTAIRFGPEGQIFVAEKSGLLLFYLGFDDPTPTQVIDLRASVHNFWDRGLLGVAVHPNFPASPYIYVLYAHDTYPPSDLRFGDPSQPRWGIGLPTPSTNDPCETPPGPTDDGCVVFGRLSRIVVNPATMVGTEQVMLEGNWCQQYPSHSTGDLVFGEDGYLYVSGGDGASFNFADWGQDGSPVNPCGDPPDGVGGPNNGLNAEGGALRSQDILTPATGSDPTSLGGALLRLDVSTQPPTAPATNPLVGNGIADDDFIVAIGLRNPFRINRRPGTNEIWITDVGWNTWEEINRVQNPTGNVENFGWPCYEGNNTTSAKQPGYQNQTLCRRLYGEVGPPIPGGITTVAPYYAYNHSAKVVPGELCEAGNSSATGLLFNIGGNFPPEYDNALLFADASRQCIWTLAADPNGMPNKNDIAPLVSQASGRVVDIQMAADGRLYYVDFDSGVIYRVEYFSANQPPTAVIAAVPTNGAAPLQVSFDATGSHDPEDGANLDYFWDLDGDGQFDDSTLAGPVFSYTQTGGHAVGLRVEDSAGASDTTSVLISVDNTPPVASIDLPLPSFQWSVGESIDYALSATDLQDGQLPGSQLSLEILMHHCFTTESCHTHPITTSSGAVGGSFPAPDHEYPAYLELRLTAEDLPPAGWIDPAWGARRKLRFDNAAQTLTLTDFPVLVTLDASRIDYAKTKPLGADLRFATPTGTQLPYEIEVWNPAGVSRVWVRVPSITAGSIQDHIFMYYDNPLADDDQDPEGVWSNGYAGVWHLHADLLDSTANHNDGANHGSTNGAGRIGDAQAFDGDDWIEMASNASLAITGQLSLEAWTKLTDANQSGAPRVLSKKEVWTDNNGYNLEEKPAQGNITTVGSGVDVIRAEPISFGTGWRYVATTVSGGNGRVYMDGVDLTTDPVLSPLVAASQPLNVGRASESGGEYFLGTIDEVRISNVQRSPSWIAAQYLSMTDAFITYEPETGPGTLTDTASLLLYPDTVDLSFDSVPQGFSLALGGNTLTTPFSRTVIVGSNNSISALTPQQQGSVVYDFASWSDGGAISHLFTAPAAPSTLTATFVTTTECADGLDNDGDTFLDAADPGCANPADASEQNSEVACDDGQDNDADSFADHLDPGCTDPADPSEQNTSVACDDGQDNDADTFADTLDPGCAGPADPSEQNTSVECDDGQDNDADTFADHLDPGCAGPADPSEQNTSVACDDGQDNDADTFADHLDPGCADPADPSEQNTSVECDDGQDNDADTFADHLDPGCADPADPSEQNTSVECDDGQDNDADTFADHLDPGCADPADPSEQNTSVECDDGQDNDADTFADHLDPGCADPADPSEQNTSVACDDGQDNDADTFADHLDPGCADPADPSEQNTSVACDDGQDNDADTFADTLDPGCAGPADPSEQNTSVACDDGQDNDADSFADHLDPGCTDPADPSEQNTSVQCDDGQDNDLDGPIDYPADSDCESATDPLEMGPPEIPALPLFGAPLFAALVFASARRRLARVARDRARG